jgi:iron complex outermembrane receptor protein
MKSILFFVLMGIVLVLNGQETLDTAKVFSLGEVTITGEQNQNENNSLLKRNMELHNTENVSKAMDYILGTSISLAGGRNEAMVYVRGYDLRQVPVFFDGVPVSVPYDGYFDLAQIQAQSIGKLTIEKGNASLLYGANTLGGAINLISSKPDKKLSVIVSSGLATGLGDLDRSTSAIQIGTKHEHWYALANFAYMEQNRITLPSAFDTSANELDKVRDNSQFKNLNYNLKFGFTPRKGQEYSVSFNGVRSSKGIPVYLGENPTVRTRYWQYPNWDKDGVYVHTKNRLNESIILKTRWYYDKYYNVLKSFDDDTYTSQTFGYAFTSTYDDYSVGGNVELGLYQFDDHKVQLGSQFLLMSHEEYNKGEQPREMKDLTTGLAIEDRWQATDKLTLDAGIGFFYRSSLAADEYFSDNDSIAEYPLNSDNSFHAQAGVSYKIDKNHMFFAKIAHKSRFATMKDRYSYRIDRAIPNPELTSETSLNYEIGYTASFDQLKIRSAVFYNFISNTIQQVDNVEDDLWQLQNTGKSEFRGFELSAQYSFLSFFRTGVNYSYISQQNISNPDLYFIDIPEHQVLGFLNVYKENLYFVNMEVEYNSSRYSTSNGEYKASEFLLVNLNVEYNFIKGFSLNAGIQNVFDKLYYYAEGYPEPGRVFRVGVKYRFATQK